MHDVAWHHEVNCVRIKDAQKQLARTPLTKLFSIEKFSGAKHSGKVLVIIIILFLIIIIIIRPLWPIV